MEIYSVSEFENNAATTTMAQFEVVERELTHIHHAIASLITVLNTIHEQFKDVNGRLDSSTKYIIDSIKEIRENIKDLEDLAELKDLNQRT